jgi:hypothetical protein
VLLCIVHDPGVRLRDIAARTGVTERTAYGIVTDLTEAGYVVKHRDGRRNRYQIQAHLPLRRPLPVPDSRGLVAIGEALALLTGVIVGAAGLSARDEGPVVPLADGSQPGTAMTDAPSMTASMCWSPEVRATSARPPPPGSPRWARGLASPAVIRASPRLPRPISAPQRATSPARIAASSAACSGVRCAALAWRLIAMAAAM